MELLILAQSAEASEVAEIAGALFGLLMMGFFFVVVPLLPIVVGGIVGAYLEKQHFQEFAEREEGTRHVPMSDLATPPPGISVGRGALVEGSVVISADHFRSMRARFRKLIGGEFKGLVKMQERAKREALLRMKEQAIAQGAVAVCNVRVETSTIAGNRPESVAGAEVIAFGTALFPAISGSSGRTPPPIPGTNVA